MACESAQSPSIPESQKVVSPNLDVAEVPPQWIESAEDALAAGRYQDAGSRFQRILAIEPDNVRAKLGLGEYFLATGDPKAAVQVFTDIIDAPEAQAIASQGRGLAFVMLGQRDAAMVDLEAAIEKDPSLWRSWNGLGHLFDNEGNWPEAERAYTKGLEIDPQSAHLHNNLGVSLLMQEEYAAAGQQFAKALELDPRFDVAETNLRVTLAWQGKYIEALTGVDHDEMPTVLNNVGYIAMRRGDLEIAESYLSRALEMSPSYYVTAAKNLEQVRNLRKKSS